MYVLRMYVCVYVCMYVCMFIHTYTHIVCVCVCTYKLVACTKIFRRQRRINILLKDAYCHGDVTHMKVSSLVRLRNPTAGKKRIINICDE